MSKAFKKVFLSLSEEKTNQHGKMWAKKISKLPYLILLEGPVGSGKTSWVKGFISGYLKKSDLVSSPSYSLINCYSAAKKEVVHADFYRLQNEDDLESVGFWDLLTKKRVILVEWGNLIKPVMWPMNLKVDVITFEIESETKRSLKIKSTN